MALIQPNIPEMEAPPLEAGVVNEPMGDLPAKGGVESVEDDIPTTAKEEILFFRMNLCFS